MGQCISVQKQPEKQRGKQSPKTRKKTPVFFNTKENQDPKKQQQYQDLKKQDEKNSKKRETVYMKWDIIISDHAKKRAHYMEQSQAAYKAGDGTKAKELSKKGKAEGDKMHKAQKDMSVDIYNYVNKKHGKPDTCDLHGQQVKFAIIRLEEFFNKVKSQHIKKVNIIYGAGNHSDKGDPKLKPEVIDYLKKNIYTFVETTVGSVTCDIRYD